MPRTQAQGNQETLRDAPSETRERQSPGRILAADDQPHILEAIELLLRPEGFDVDTAKSPAAVREALASDFYDAVLIDLNYTRDTTSGQEGLDLLSEIVALDSSIPVIVMTAWGNVRLAVEAMRRGARDFIQKPWENERLLAILRTQVELHRALQRTQHLEAEARLLRAEGRPEFIAAAPSMQPVLQTIARIGPSDANVLVTGEHGTGKEVVAQTLHALSPRANMPLVAVNTGALPEGTFESELFGHVKGAFTDARTDRIGRFELADNGTIFLDEIGNVPIRQQAKLLRVLETGEIERVGSSRTKRINVRVISATNTDLQAAIAAGHFREDLLFRLNTVEIHVPALRERREDIPALAAHFLKRYAARYRARGERIRGAGSAGDDAICVAGKCARAGAHAGARGADVPHRRDSGFGPRPERATSAGPEPRRAQHRRGRGDSRPQGAAALSRQREPGGGGAGLESRRSVPPDGTLWSLVPAATNPDRPAARTPHVRFRPSKLLFEKRIALFAVLAALPGVAFGTTLIWTSAWPRDVKIALTALEFFLWLVLTLVLLDQIVRPLQTLANVVGALREEDYSFRARGAAPNDALGELALEINSLADILTEQRIQTIEATALLRRVVDEIDAPLFTFDPDHVLRLVNAAGERLLQQPAARLLGQTAAELELNACFEARNETLVALPYSTPNARWMVRKSSFRQNGVPHTLIVLSDVSRALREQERSAWQRLIRVLGHELNNSLAPIISIAGSLASRLPLPELPEAQNADFQRGLNIIESRTAALHRFLQSYRRLAQMPSPTLQPVELRPLLERVAVLETRLNVEIASGPDIVLMIDPDLIEQMLINLVRNAVDAALEQAQSPQAGSQPAEPKVSMRWEQFDRKVALMVEDNGIGLLNPSNAFVPFYTTKQGGSGIGLVLSQQIAEAHGGTIELANRQNARGCIVKVLLP